MNHEYCEDCGQNDFHHGRPCDPILKAKKDTERAEIEKWRVESVRILTGLAAELNSRGYVAKFDQYNNLRVSTR